MTTKTTFHLSISRPAMIAARIRNWLGQRDPIRLVLPLSLAVLCLLVAGALYRTLTTPAALTPTRAPAPLPTAAAIVVIRREVASPVPTLAPPLVTAYASPNGVAFPDPIVQPAPADWIARWGNEWIEVRYQPNPVWIRAADVGAVLTDVAISDPQIHPIAPAPVAAPAPEPSYQVTNEAPAAEAPHQHLFGLTEADMDQALAEHQAQQLASCDAGRITNATYCQAVKQWMEEHR